MMAMADSNSNSNSKREIRQCSKCNLYKRALGRCAAGKINPPTIKGGVSAAKLMGISYICPWAKHRDKIRARIEEIDTYENY